MSKKKRSRGANWQWLTASLRTSTGSGTDDSDSAFAYASRGQTYAALKDYQRAVQDFDRALELDSNYTWARDRREEAYRQLKKPKWMHVLGL